MAAPRGPRFVGDTKQARDGAWVFTAITVVPLVIAAFVALTWYRAQVEGWSQNLRVPHAGDPFPWLWVGLCVVASAFFLRMALRGWSRYRTLRAADRARS
ncbi:hypothetical protein IF650_00180 [Cellulosimicrobium terreum]|nr:hypothetical protein [Cellulosimicrobium terreum]